MYISYERSTGLSREYQSVPLTLDTPATCATCFAMNLHRWDHHYSCPHSWQMMYKSMSTVSCTFRPLQKRVRCSKCRFIRDKILKKIGPIRPYPHNERDDRLHNPLFGVSSPTQNFLATPLITCLTKADHIAVLTIQFNRAIALTYNVMSYLLANSNNSLSCHTPIGLTPRTPAVFRFSRTCRF